MTQLLEAPEATPKTLLEACAKMLEAAGFALNVDGRMLVNGDMAAKMADVMLDYLRQKFCTVQIQDIARDERDRFREMLRIIEHGGIPSWLTEPQAGCECGPESVRPCHWCEAHE